MKPVCHIVAGPNGAGKSTFALARPDCAERKKADADWRLGNLLEQFKAAGIKITPDVWDRLEADRRQSLEDDLAWIRRGRKESVR